MEAEVYSLQTRNKGHRKGLEPRSPTASSSLSPPPRTAWAQLPSPRMPRTPTAIHRGGSASEPCTPSLSAEVCSEGRGPRAGLTFPCCLRPRVRGGTGGHAQSARSWSKGRDGRLRASSRTGAVARLWLCRSPPSCSLNTQPGFPGIWQLAGVGVPGAESPGRKEGRKEDALQ